MQTYVTYVKNISVYAFKSRVHLTDHYFCTTLDVNFAVSKYAHLEAKLLKYIVPGHAGCC